MSSSYEMAREANIQRNHALLAELNLSVPAARGQSRASSRRQPTRKAVPGTSNHAKRQKLDIPPTRTSARLATSERPTYNEGTIAAAAVRKERSARGRRGARSSRRKQGAPAESQIEDQTDQAVENTGMVPGGSVDAIVSGWRSWKPVAAPPSRDPEGTFHFDDFPTFLPNKSPAEVIREGAFGGGYYRPVRSRKLGIVVRDDWEELPRDWIDGLDVATFLTSSLYDPDTNKFKVACGQSIEEWEASGWIAHEFDVRGWFQWYTRFFRGRRCEDDDRQVSRWRKCVGETGRWRRMLLKKYGQLGVRTVWDDGEDEDAPQVSPVMHQTCHHWAWEVRQEVLDEFWS